jgi:hypothetical protein
VVKRQKQQDEAKGDTKVVVMEYDMQIKGIKVRDRQMMVDQGW